ncbi:S-adenosylmethionine synthetase [Pyrenophora tritici-repentis Pt-1C-BFP]|uniref:S-adenosylmethionine synthetase n=1 Tax=Pyrenophora tritici-repentis (strain Pt-1C-BFP) TaxID=426418 RepID=B2WN20_PYRTR|nr:S-adenosylmethionine synthetase [Pyrenophora tritici-repentis Pt-1C-BFP]EDU44519.1 S-adenosylmethionine synthetase [Pyrenophora tritici-repentis Pt-1C-BFP]
MTVPNGNGKSTFLFTSESVGEGHPDKIWYVDASMFPQLLAISLVL